MRFIIHPYACACILLMQWVQHAVGMHAMCTGTDNKYYCTHDPGSYRRNFKCVAKESATTATTSTTQGVAPTCSSGLQACCCDSDGSCSGECVRVPRGCGFDKIAIASTSSPKRAPPPRLWGCPNDAGDARWPSARGGVCSAFVDSPFRSHNTLRFSNPDFEDGTDDWCCPLSLPAQKMRGQCLESKTNPHFCSRDDFILSARTQCTSPTSPASTATRWRAPICPLTGVPACCCDIDDDCTDGDDDWCCDTAGRHCVAHPDTCKFICTHDADADAPGSNGRAACSPDYTQQGEAPACADGNDALCCDPDGSCLDGDDDWCCAVGAVETAGAVGAVASAAGGTGGGTAVGGAAVGSAVGGAGVGHGDPSKRQEIDQITTATLKDGKVNGNVQTVTLRFHSIILDRGAVNHAGGTIQNHSLLRLG